MSYCCAVIQGRIPFQSTVGVLCADAEGAIWAASPTTGMVLRLAEGGDVLARIATGRQAIACALGGHSGNTLFVSTAIDTHRATCLAARTARIDAFQVPVPAP